MQSAQTSMEQLKQRMRGVWMAGDFGQIARYSAQGAQEFVDRLTVEPAMDVLDVACGTGNLAIPAARRGAHVTGIDIAPNLLEQAHQAATAEGLSIKFEEGDAEQLPYPDASFDLVMTMFGAMFAPRPEITAKELMRVCRTGGRLAMANWTPESFPGEMFRLSARHVAPPEGVPPPVLWGDERVVRERLQTYSSNIETTRRKLRFEYPFSPVEAVQFFIRYFGPVQSTLSRLDEKGKAAFTSDLENLWKARNEGDDTRTIVYNEYLEVVATRA
jgi:ubiquinone/menaquinone biosynthesis C-methylase UbiE